MNSIDHVRTYVSAAVSLSNKGTDKLVYSVYVTPAHLKTSIYTVLLYFTVLGGNASGTESPVAKNRTASSEI